MKLFSIGVFILLIIPDAQAQSVNNNPFQSLNATLTQWDSVRGPWLSSALLAYGANEKINTRDFPEDATPFELLRKLPPAVFSSVKSSFQNSNSLTATERKQFERIKNLTQRIGCNYVVGRSYGDPHLSSFDKANYSFQTVGEFVLFRSADGTLELQCRQSPGGSNVSLNTAVAVYVNGDKVGVYASGSPDGDPELLRVNGRLVSSLSSTFLLPYGGNIRMQGNIFVVSAPGGEQVLIEPRTFNAVRFFNVSVHVFSCQNIVSEGLLGNADGNPDNDFATPGRPSRGTYSSLFGSANLSKLSATAEREYLAFLAGKFADKWRVSDATTLFDYADGKNTLSFTDRTFPSVHLTIQDLTPEQQDRARKNCAANDVGEEDMRGCIYDQAFLNLEPSPRTSPPDFTQNMPLNKIETRSVPNVKAMPNNISEVPGKQVLQEINPGENLPIQPVDPAKNPVKIPSQVTDQLNNNLKNIIKTPQQKPSQNTTPNQQKINPSILPSNKIPLNGGGK